MDPTGQSLLRLLFDPGESICVSDSQFAYHSIPLENINKEKIELISPNEKVPVKQCNSSDLILCSINPINGFRLDSNVTAFRSFLIEMDIGDIKSQLNTIAHYGVPFSAQIWSGGKSVHTVITLDEDLPDEKSYRLLGKWIFNIITYADKACANPSRMVRLPGVYREPGKKQRLIKINKRVTHEELMYWLNQYKHLQPVIKVKPKVEGTADYSRLSPWARVMLEKGIVFREGRNKTWFALAVDCAKAGFSEDDTVVLLGTKFQEESDFKEKEWLTSIKSAFKYVAEGK